MKRITVSAPGKLMLFGEHAVVYNHPCIVTAVGQRMTIIVEQTDTTDLHIEAPDVQVSGYTKPISRVGEGSIPKGAQFIEMAVRKFKQKYPFSEGLRITSSSEFSSLYGFGSSSASTVCVIKALAELFEKNLQKKEIFDLAYQTVLDIQGTGSGFDVAAAIYGGTIYFVTGGKTIEQLSISTLPLIVAYSGTKADTTTLVHTVAKLKENNPKLVEGIFAQIEEITNQAKTKIERQEWEAVGNLMDSNQLYLDQLDIMTDKLSLLTHSAKKAGALGAKISGAGGGDCIIALSPDKKNIVENSLEKTGSKILQVETSVEGVRVEQ